MSKFIATKAGNITVIAEETTGQKVRRLQTEAKELARAHIGEMVCLMGDLRALATDVAGGGDAYPPGIRDLARQLADSLEASAQTVDSIVAKAP